MGNPVHIGRHIYKAGDWTFYFFLAVAILMAVIASYSFLTSGGDPQKVATSKGILWWGRRSSYFGSSCQNNPNNDQNSDCVDSIVSRYTASRLVLVL